MITTRPSAATAAVAVAALSTLVAACHGSAGSGGASSVASALNGTYAPAGDAAHAEFASITFADAKTYRYQRAACTVSCTSSGTFTFDGEATITLEDAATHATRAIAFQALAVEADDDTSGAQSTHVRDGLVSGSGGSLVTGSGSPLVAASGSPLVSGEHVTKGTMDGVTMALQPARNVPDTSNGVGTCATPAAMSKCTSMSGNFVAAADGSCTCSLVFLGAGAVDAGT